MEITQSPSEETFNLNVPNLFLTHTFPFLCCHRSDLASDKIGTLVRKIISLYLRHNTSVIILYMALRPVLIQKYLTICPWTKSSNPSSHKLAISPWACHLVFWSIRFFTQSKGVVLAVPQDFPPYSNNKKCIFCVTFSIIQKSSPWLGVIGLMTRRC